MQNLSTAERAAIMKQDLRTLTFDGYRIVTVDRDRAVVLAGSPVNHILHLLVAVLTCGLWGLVWLLLVVLGGEKRTHVHIDEYGNFIGLGPEMAARLRRGR